MYRIKREKGSRVHYATRVGPPGNLEGLTEDVVQAAWFSAEVIARVREHYRHRAKAGKLTFEAQTAAAPVPDPKSQRGRFRDQGREPQRAEEKD